MIIRRCRINSRADYRADFDYPGLYELRRISAEGFVQMFSVLRMDIESRREKGDNRLIDSILQCAGEKGQISSEILLERIRRIAGGDAKGVWMELPEDRNFVKAVLEKREAQLTRPMPASAAQEVWLFEALHRLARVQAKEEDWDYLMTRLDGSQWTTENQYGLKGHREIQLPYCQEAEQEELRIVRLTNDSILPKEAQLAGTRLRWKLFKGDTLFALRRGEMGYTGFLGCARDAEAEAFERAFGCVVFRADGTIDFGSLCDRAKSLYHMPCLTADGSTAFIGVDSRLYRVDEGGNLAMIGNPDNITIVMACAMAAGEYIVMDEKGGVRRIDEKGGDMDASGAQAVRSGAFAMAMHAGMCCVLAEQDENGVQLRLFGGDAAARGRLQTWFAEKEKRMGKACSMQTAAGEDGKTKLIVGFEKGGVASYA